MRSRQENENSDMKKEDYEKLILSLEGIKQREWNEIKNHIDKQFDLQFSNLNRVGGGG